MRTLFIILGSIAAVISFLLSFFMGGIAYIPIVAGAIFGIIALIISKKNLQRETVPKLIIALCFLAGVITSVNLMKEDKVADDNIIELKEEKSKEDAQKELDQIDELNEIEE